MKCDFLYCIYNENFVCVLGGIEMNSLGQCEACIIVSLPEQLLTEYKRMQLQVIMGRYEDLSE